MKPEHLDHFCAIGIDVGGTKTAAGLVMFPAGDVRSKRTIATQPARGGEAVLQDVEDLVQQLCAEARDAQHAVRGIGLGICELVDEAGNVLSENCLAWKRVPVQQRLSRFAPVHLEADVRAAALGEALFGAGRQFRNFLYVTIGTGISSCLVIDGRPYAGTRGASGTFASSPLSWTCEQCGHIEKRSLEEIASGPGMVACFNQRSSRLAKSGEEVLAAANAGDSAGISIVQSAGHALGSAVALLVNVLDPEAVIVGGGLGLASGLYWDSFLSSARRHIWSEVHRLLPIVPAARGPDAGLIGAAAAIWKRMTKS